MAILSHCEKFSHRSFHNFFLCIWHCWIFFWLLLRFKHFLVYLITFLVCHFLGMHIDIFHQFKYYWLLSFKIFFLLHVSPLFRDSSVLYSLIVYYRSWMLRFILFYFIRFLFSLLRYIQYLLACLWFHCFFFFLCYGQSANKPINLIPIVPFRLSFVFPVSTVLLKFFICSHMLSTFFSRLFIIVTLKSLSDHSNIWAISIFGSMNSFLF